MARTVHKELEEHLLSDIKLSEYLDRLKVSKFFRDYYLLPLIGSIWSGDDSQAADFPAATFATFFRNHGMLNLSDRPKWQTIVGGSHAYVKKFRSNFRGTIFLNSPVAAVSRTSESVKLSLADGETLEFDYVVLATHADEAVKILSDPSAAEKEILGTWKYSSNDTVLHTDTSIVPGSPKTWASWNYFKRIGHQNEAGVQMSYYMNRLQALKTEEHHIVTLNRTKDVAPEKSIYNVEYTHPVYTPRSVKAQGELKLLNGANRTLFAGAYLGYGFHEDGVNSGLDVASHFGMSL